MAQELAALRAENARMLPLLKLTRTQAAPPGPARAGPAGIGTWRLACAAKLALFGTWRSSRPGVGTATDDWPSSTEIAILIAMSFGEQMPLADVKNRLSEVVDRLEREHGRVVITKHGHPAAVVISVEDLESLEETLDVMDSPALLDDIREALSELGTASAPVMSKAEALRLITDR
jgi:antitoxin YefM